MAAVPANLANDLDTAFGKALYSAGGWQQGLGLPFSLSSLLNLIEGGGTIGGPFTSLSVTPGLSALQALTATTLNTSGLLTAAAGISVTGGTIAEGAATTALSLIGNSSASGTGVILDNVTTQTSGNSAVSIRSGGAEQASFDFAGNLNIGTSGGTASRSTDIYLNSANSPTAYQSIVRNTQFGALELYSPVEVLVQNPAGGPGLAVTSTTNTSAQPTVLAGHFLSAAPASTVIGYLRALPLITWEASGFGTPTGVTVTGSDLSGRITFTTGTATAIAANTLCFYISLCAAYSSSSQFNSFCSFAAVPSTAAELTSFYCVPANSSTVGVYNITAFTPISSTVYSLQFLTMGAGATS